MRMGSIEPMLKISPEVPGSSMSPFRARIVSETWQKLLTWLPSPKISSGAPVSALETNRGITIP